MRTMRWLAIARMTDAGLRTSYLSPERTTARMSSDLRTFSRVITEADIRAE